MLGDVLHHAFGPRAELLQELHGVRERARADMREERIVDGAQLRYQALDALRSGKTIEGSGVSSGANARTIARARYFRVSIACGRAGCARATAR